jgi:hypothetical protein
VVGRVGGGFGLSDPDWPDFDNLVSEIGPSRVGSVRSGGVMLTEATR